MDVSGEVADLMVKEGIQLTEASIKLLASGSMNLAAFLWALAKDNHKLVGKTSMARLIRESKDKGKALKVFRVKESDLAEFRAFAKKNMLFAAVKYKNSTDGLVDLITNVDYVAQVNYFMERKGYPAPKEGQEAEAPKKAAPRAPQENCSPERGSGWKPPMKTATPTSEKPSVKGRLAALQAAADGMKPGRPAQQQNRSGKPKIK